MTRHIKLVYGVGIVILLVSLYFDWNLHKTHQNFKTNAQANLVLGVGLIGQAHDLIKRGNAKAATPVAYEGIGYLRASAGEMEQLGVDNVSGVASFMDQAMSNILDLDKQPADTGTKEHDQQVIETLESNFKPFARINYGSMSDGQLKQALDHVYQAMTPQERQQFGG
ncbi:hypothetical protein [Alicyclobacillus acidoterrestris]|uniref:Uncharacterized protein n=1 Tax=Alicyclobacillus acidoterrestris (strain ATCC 49025 / DSM 3922 / CIP 106132 / NCIMB 13137 / GD3B) TaxID=1356854 RepID=T0D244_ALIAG|nr:hypothetical protein [Alicyclobacillus acidoterrestris]EPZ45622.1 hypothetical protein N007_08235 [Alicyclobacillus acidoterrestris ATCC 49025]UNO47304.1 hypothetical protein K1I37_11220 [Alicyclobacillus acidoterrestris]